MRSCYCEMTWSSTYQPYWSSQSINQSITLPASFFIGEEDLLSGFGFRKKLLIWHQTHPAWKMQDEYFLLAVRGFWSWVGSTCFWLCCSHPPTRPPIASDRCEELAGNPSYSQEWCFSFCAADEYSWTLLWSLGPGTPVTLTLHHLGDTLDFTLTWRRTWPATTLGHSGRGKKLLAHRSNKFKIAFCPGTPKCLLCLLHL